MRAPDPPGWPWLLRHELRMLWRVAGVRSWLMAILAVLLLVAIHAAGWAVVSTGLLERLALRAPQVIIVMSLITLLLVQSAAFGLAVRALFDRGDLDLLLSAPLPALHVFVARGVAVALGSVGALAFIVLPMADMGPFAHRWRLLAAWPALLAIGLGAAAIAFAVTLALVRAIGLRRARVAAQLLGVLVGAGFVLFAQVPAALPRATREALLAPLRSPALTAFLGPDSVLLLPWRALLGEPAPLAIVVLAGTGLFALVATWMSRSFVHAVQAAPAALAPGRPRKARAQGAFREGLASVVVRKELRLLARDPMLIGRALLQAVYLIPLFLVMVRRAQALDLLAAALVVLASSLASTLAWMAMAGEEAPDFLGTAPVGLRRLRVLKVAAVALPVGVLVLPFLAWFWTESAATGAIASAFVAIAVASSACVQVWTAPLGGGTRDLRARGGQQILVRLVDNLASFGWAAGCYGTLAGSRWAFAGLGIGLVGPMVALILARMRR